MIRSEINVIEPCRGNRNYNLSINRIFYDNNSMKETLSERVYRERFIDLAIAESYGSKENKNGK